MSKLLTTFKIPRRIKPTSSDFIANFRIMAAIDQIWILAESINTDGSINARTHNGEIAVLVDVYTSFNDSLSISRYKPKETGFSI